MGDIGDLIQKARKSTATTLKEDPNLRRQALEKFLHENPDVKHKMAAAKKAVGKSLNSNPQLYTLPKPYLNPKARTWKRGTKKKPFGTYCHAP